MTVTTTGASRPQFLICSFAQVLALTSAALLGVASVTTNVASAIARHPDLAGKFVSGAVALAVALLAMIGLAASLQALSRRQFILSAMAALAFVLAAAFSVSSALGVMGGARLQASMSANHVEGERKRISDERANASAELTMTNPARSIAEITPELSNRLSIKGVDGCTSINGPISRQHCPVISALQGELARAERIAALNGAIARLDGEASNLGAPQLANRDSAAVSHVLAALGLKLDAEVINTALMVLAVLILEVGPALSLAVATALRSQAPIAPVMRDISPAPASVPRQGPAAVPSAPVPSRGLAKDAADRVAKIARDAGGELRAPSKNALAKQVGASSGTMSRALAVLAAGGAAVASDSSGVAIKLAA